MVVPPTALKTDPPDKAGLRQLLKAKRAAFVTGLSPSERCAAASDLAAQVRRHLDVRGVVAAFLPIGEEIDTMPLIDDLARDGAMIALPHVTGRAEPLRFLAWHPGAATFAGPFGVSQPAATAKECAPDVILTPLLGFDSALHRIGYGAGYYDRAFAARPAARRIGLAWSVQQVDTIPTDPWDVPLHAMATERGWIEQ